MRILLSAFMFLPFNLSAQYAKERELYIHNSPITFLVIDEQRDELYSGDAEGYVYVSGLASGRQKGSFKGHTGKITHLDISSTGHQLLTASYDGTLKIWDTRNYALLKTVPNSFGKGSGTIRGNEPTFALFENKDTNIIYGGYNARVHRSNLYNNTTETIFECREGGITCGILLSGYHKIAFAANNLIFIYDLIQKSITDTLYSGQAIYDNYICEITTIPNRPDMLAGTLYDGKIIFWSLTTRQIIKSSLATTRKGSFMIDIADNGYILSGNNESDGIIRDVDNLKVIHRLKGHRSEVKSVALKNDSRYAVTGGNDHKVIIWKKPDTVIDTTRRIILQDSLEVHKRDLELSLYDDAYEDGDILSLILNDVVVLTEYKLKKNKHTFHIILNKPNNILTVFVHNEGLRSPNTAAIDIVEDGHFLKKVTLRSSKNTSAALLFKFNQN